MFKGLIVTGPDFAASDGAGWDSVGPDCTGPEHTCTRFPSHPDCLECYLLDAKGSLTNGLSHTVHTRILLLLRVLSHLVCPTGYPLPAKGCLSY
jgi:hypothetical protein